MLSGSKDQNELGAISWEYGNFWVTLTLFCLDSYYKVYKINRSFKKFQSPKILAYISQTCYFWTYKSKIRAQEILNNIG